MGDTSVGKYSSGGAYERLQVPNISDAWSAINISLSALLYLFDFATNLLTLHTFYLYSIVCPRYYSDSYPSGCKLISKGGHSFISVFFVCLALMVVAHLSNTLIFWRTLDPSQHPLRLAYFLPLIHLSNLIKLLWSTCSCNRLQDLLDNQKESSGLYNILAASLETAPQLMLQFHVLMEFGDEYYWLQGDTYYYSVTAEPVKKTLILSLVASLVSGTYNGSVAVLSLLQNRGLTSLPWKACILMVAGLHVLAAMAAKTLIVAALAQYVSPVLVYLLIGVIVTWIFFAFVLQKSPYYVQYSGNNHKRWVHGLHSLTLAHVSLFIGPMYVIVKHFDRPTSFLMKGTILHIFVELLGLGAVLLTLGANAKNPLPNWPAWETPCHYNFHHINGETRDNIYLSCNVFVEAVCPLLFLLFISSLVFAMVVKRAMSCESKHQLANLNVSQYEHELAVLNVASNQMGTIAPNLNASEVNHELAVLDVASSQMDIIAPGGITH